jgi:hypothetical protein
MRGRDGAQKGGVGNSGKVSIHVRNTSIMIESARRSTSRASAVQFYRKGYIKWLSEGVIEKEILED